MKFLWFGLMGLMLLTPAARAASSGAGEFRGTIVSVQYVDVLKEEEDRYDLAIMTVENIQGISFTVIINRDTKIKSPTWGDAHLVYLQKDMRVRVEYSSSAEGQQWVARNVYVEKE